MYNQTICKLLSLMFAFSMLIISGCNTVEGFGKDVEGAGETISDTADDVKDKMKD